MTAIGYILLGLLVFVGIMLFVTAVNALTSWLTRNMPSSKARQFRAQLEATDCVCWATRTEGGEPHEWSCPNYAGPPS